MADILDPCCQTLPSSPKANILLVDDQPANLLSLRAILEDLGQNLVEAHSGLEAFRLLQDSDFAVVLLDVQMPGQDGFETASLMRGREESRHTPIIFLTGYDNDRFSVERAYSLGVVDYLEKPLVPVILRAKVAGFIDLFQKTQQVKQQAECLRQMERREFETRLGQENARLRESEQRFARFMQHLPGLAWIKDLQGRYVYANDAAVRTFRTSWPELYGKTDAELFPSQTAAQFQANDQRAITSQTGVQMIETLEHEDGVLHRSLVSKFPILGADGHALLVGGMAIDITDQLQAEHAQKAAQEQLHIVTDSMSALVSRCSRDLVYLWVSQPYADWLRRPPDDIVGRSIQEVIGQEAFAVLRPYFEQVLSGQKVSYEEEVNYRGLGCRWVNAVYTPTWDVSGHVDGWVAVVIDIDARKRAEQALQEAHRRKDEFLATLAHELRNPLAPIRNALHILKQPTANKEVLRQVREMAERQVQHMAKLLDDLLDVSRISRGRIELAKETVDVAAVISRTVDAVGPLFEEREHQLTVSLPPVALQILADPTRLEQVLTNLLNNAAKYTDPGGNVWLTAERDGGEVVLRVRDTGIGIATDMLPKIFDLFVQAERRLDRSHGGVGIGLTLVKQLIELHGGTVDAHSAGLGQGSEFVVRLPAALGGAAPARGGACQVNATSNSVASRRVLVVDDNVDGADSIGLLLKLGGHDVRVAYDGPTALLVAQAFLPEVVLLDIGMPGMDGYEVARQLRGEAGHQAVLLVAVTGWGQEADRQRSLGGGFNHHLVKPVEPKVLAELLAHVQRPNE
jgi:PAS domain S-box-containing protein